MKKSSTGPPFVEPNGPSTTSICDVVRLRLDDLDEAVDVHMEAFQGYMNAALGRRYVRKFLYWFCSATDGIAFGARTEKSLVGYVVGAPIGYGSRLNRDLALVVAGSLALRPWLILRSDIRRALMAKLQVLLGRIDSPPVGSAENPQGLTASLVGIGVSSAARGKGAGASLIGAFEAEAKKRGIESVRLSVYRNNRIACRAYERAGWNVLDSNDEETVYYTKNLREDH